MPITNDPVGSTVTAPNLPPAVPAVDDYGNVLPTATMESPPKPTTFLDTYKQNHPEMADHSDYGIARTLYDSGSHKDGESFPEFATRIGISEGALGTALNT